VVETHRGLLLGVVLERLKPALESKPEEVDFRIVREATADDLATARQLTDECEDAFADWCARILKWNLNLELIDLERTLDRQKLILYVLCERGPDSTKLALQAAATGLGLVEVQPVSATGPIQLEGKSCGSGGGGCGCSH
jgi:cell fate regulator YaaT (PSP1 superfamily)